MNHSLIINLRGQLRWQHRLFSDATTAALWGYWLWLCRPLIGAATWLIGTVLQHPIVQSVALSSTTSLPRTAIALCSTSGSLLIWSHITHKLSVCPLVPAVVDYADYFKLCPAAIQAGRDRQVSVVHHDERGRIVRVEAYP
ncbi:MAG: poly-beta-1,6-N-acetyl-D-glucosamine biosynthesis protein PgaD [Steroidobacteraceae bacterium]